MEGQVCKDSCCGRACESCEKGFVLAAPVLLGPQYLTEAAEGDFISAHRVGRF